MFGERLATARENAGLTQEEVAKQIGVTQTAYSFFEKGLKTPSLVVTKRIAVLLNTSIDYLVGDTD